MSEFTWNDGIIKLDSKPGKELGFTSDKFEEDSYLWKIGDAISVSFIASKAKGNFRALAQTILGRGWSVHIPTPLGRMKQIVIKNGYEKTMEPFFEGDPPNVEVWIKRPERN